MLKIENAPVVEEAMCNSYHVVKVDGMRPGARLGEHIFQVRLTLLLQSILEGTLSEKVGQQCILTVRMSPAADADSTTPA